MPAFFTGFASALADAASFDLAAFFAVLQENTKKIETKVKTLILKCLKMVGILIVIAVKIRNTYFTWKYNLFFSVFLTKNIQ
ncbi:hypothetical protein GCM10011531_26320 [Aquaticitalea lipolytica]|uniref:Uncharacterized protein n=1 Tax=Aquaticitalea lipolytica TaxID=1247562 RepID=A0A8J2TS16_9FLAO|nr:hypothetical protein GCM10011531_26320 [Aquaticitalea lipolytica]